jgi:[glutamine synthetase] adenylyltransferase / [glutamine synthetase]-adenylyl-L-tyrosine phosphorylase
VETLATRLIESLERGEADVSALDISGAPSPERAALAFRRAATHPDLAGSIPIWAPACLASARPEYAARTLVELAERCRAKGLARLDPKRHVTLPRVLGSSGFLARLLLRRPDWIEALVGDLPDAPSRDPIDADWDAIRLAKYCGLLRVAARDLAGRSFTAGLQELSDLADRCLIAGLSCASLESDVAPPALLALGKLGGQELNFSSDVDLLFLHDTPEGTDPIDRNHAAQRLIRHLKTKLEQPTEDGFVYRVDLDLRPEGPTGVLANSVDAALAYYETWGAEWERQMLIRLRPVAGPREIASSFVSAITPFVYRRLIDPSAMQSVGDMKSRIEDERRRAGRDLETDLKEGPGGIRDVEFLVQSFQLFFGGRHESLRSGNVLVTLAALAELELLPPNTAPALTECYAWLRRAEHALQLAEEQQTHRFPRDAAEQLALARRMGYRDAEGKRARERLLDDWVRVRSEVRAHFEALVFGGT